MRGPRSEPPIPIFTTSVIGFPERGRERERKGERKKSEAEKERETHTQLLDIVDGPSYHHCGR